ncbi:MAG: methyltransferase domain-containing protein [Candidatus Pacebacteria bacterium]|nr:methyltransferase domain-containing protein [Candidatus Paceibacterota bacterium]
MQHPARSHVPLNTEGFAHPVRNSLHFELQPGMQVADFGAGSGHYVWPIAEAIGEGGKLYAIDVQRELLKRIHNESAKRGLKNVKIIWSDLEKPKASKLAGGTIDLVLISNLLFQLEDTAVVLREAKRILKPSGSLVAIDWADSFGMMGPHKKQVVAKAAGDALIREAGFEIVREFNAGAHHWGLIARPDLGTPIV